MAKIFLVEDDEFMGQVYAKSFSVEGHTLLTASDGEDALLKLEKIEEIPDLILLDVMMPKMSGFDVLRKLKENEKLKNIPVIMFTNVEDKHHIEKGLRLGAELYLIKSQYTPKQIISKVEEILKSRPTK